MTPGALYLDLRRQLQRYTIGLYPHEILAAARSGILYEVRKGTDLWICPEGFYDQKLGLVTEPSASQIVV